MSVTILLGDKRPTICRLVSFVGQVIFMAPVVGKISGLKTHFCQMTIAGSPSYDSETIISELNFWLSGVERMNIRNCVVSNPPKLLSIYGYASATGCGSSMEGRSEVAARSFTQSERDAHSTWRELENVHFTLKSFLPFIKNCSVTIFVDNESSVNIIQNGSMKPECHQFAVEIFKTCTVNKVSLNMKWIPRDQNKEADLLSRLSDFIDTADWGLTTPFFKIINTKFGPFSVDCFANYYSEKVKQGDHLIPRREGIVT
jgi:hypothetical protein